MTDWRKIVDEIDDLPDNDLESVEDLIDAEALDGEEDAYEGKEDTTFELAPEKELDFSDPVVDPWQDMFEYAHNPEVFWEE